MHILKYEFLDKITSYKSNEEIPFSQNKEHYVLENDYKWYFFSHPEYQQVILDEIEALSFLLNLYINIINAEKEIELIKNDPKELYFDEYMSQFTKDEWLMFNQIKIWTQIRNTSQEVFKFPKNCKQLFLIKAIITKFDLQKEKLQNENCEFSKINISYLNILSEFIPQLKWKLQECIPAYFSCDTHFTNSGESYFVVDIDTYCYFVGWTRGNFSLNSKKYFIDNFDSFYFEQVLIELQNLKNTIKEIDRKINLSIYSKYERLKQIALLPDNFLETLVRYNVLSLQEDKFLVKKGYRTFIISFLCKQSDQEQKAPYDLFEELFSNYKIDYDENKSNRRTYYKNNVLPFIKKYFPNFKPRE